MLDTHLPDLGNKGGLQVINTLRGRKVPTPVIVLSRDETLSTKLTTLSAGADDYMVLPYHPDEIIARILAVHRRDRTRADNKYFVGESPTFGPFTLDETEQVVKHGNEYVHLPDPKILDVTISKIRKKQEIFKPGKNYIQNVFRVGYALYDTPIASDGRSKTMTTQPKNSGTLDI